MFPPEHMQAHGYHLKYVNVFSPPQHFISYQMEQVTLTHYISWYPCFYGL